MLNLAQLETLRAVARTGSFSQAGRELYLTQPAISQRIRQIEDAFGVRLFERERENRGVRLTPAGMRVLAFAEETIATYNELRSEFTSQTDDPPATVTVASAGMFVAKYAITPLLRRCYAAHYAFPVRFMVSPASTLEGILRAGEADFSFSHQRRPAADLLSVPIISNRWHLVASPEHPLAQDWPGSCPYGTVLPLLLAPADSEIRKTVEHRAELSKISIRPVMECPDLEAIKEAAVQGMGLAFAPDVAIEQELQDGSLVVLSSSELSFDFKVYMIAVRGRAMSREAEIMIEVAESDEWRGAAGLRGQPDSMNAAAMDRGELLGVTSCEN